MKKIKRFRYFFMALLTAGLCLVGCSGNETQDNVLSLNESTTQQDNVLSQDENTMQQDNVTFGNLANFSAEIWGGGTFTQADLASKDLTIVNIWSLGCSPCVEEMPKLAKLQKALPNNVQLITVSVDGLSNERALNSVLKGSDYTGITLVTFDGDLATINNRVMYVPTTLFFDKDGNAVGTAIIGSPYQLEETYLNAINTILRGMGKDEITLAQ